MNSEAREFFLSKSHPPPLTHSYCKSNGKERDRRLDFVQMGGSGWLTPWNRRPSHIVHPVSKKLPTPILLIRRTHQRSAFSFRRDHQSQRNVDAAMEYFVVQWTDPSGIFSSPNEIASTMEPNPRVVFGRISCDCLKRRINDGRALEQIIYDGLIGDVF